MKVKEVHISLDFMGKPVIQFEAIPETNLEKDALKAIGWHIDYTAQSSMVHKESLKVSKPLEPDENRNSYLIQTFWQVDGGKV